MSKLQDKTFLKMKQRWEFYTSEHKAPNANGLKSEAEEWAEELVFELVWTRILLFLNKKDPDFWSVISSLLSCRSLIILIF